eukprot:TRINITY_DN7488_c0_g1_i2.p1 TRINITY_DN7488_c0_g1~~TRINITY_DN7488_c0_g1_i2.p1  ORF type:complete len:414 (+),score=102.71 TRINITY_DN7488_c0_g1_i2:68-1243(+)
MRVRGGACGAVPLLCALSVHAAEQCTDGSARCGDCFAAFAAAGGIHTAALLGGAPEVRLSVPLPGGTAVSALAVDGSRGVAVWAVGNRLFRAVLDSGEEPAALAALARPPGNRFQAKAGVELPMDVRGLALDEDSHTAYVSAFASERRGTGYRVYALDYLADPVTAAQSLRADWCGDKQCGALSRFPSGGGLAFRGGRLWLAAAARKLRNSNALTGGVQLRWWSTEKGQEGQGGELGALEELTDAAGGGLDAGERELLFSTVGHARGQAWRIPAAGGEAPTRAADLHPSWHWDSDDHHDGVLRPPPPLVVASSPAVGGQLVTTNGTHLWLTDGGPERQQLFALPPAAIDEIAAAAEEPPRQRNLAIGVLARYCLGDSGWRPPSGPRPAAAD